MGITSTEIVCHSDRSADAAYRCGDTVNGTVNVKIGGHKSHQFKMMLLKVRVRAKTDWEEDDTSYGEVQELYHLDIPLKSMAAGETASLPPGEHRLPFSFSLPQRLPHSQKFDEAKVVYELKARLRSASLWSRDGLHKTQLTVLPELDLSQQPQLAEPLKVYREDKRNLWGGNPGAFSATIAKQGYVAGETIDMWIEAADGVYTELAELDGMVKLKRCVVARAGKKSHHEQRTPVAAVRPGKSASAWHRVQLTVPEQEITMDDETLCHIISVTYYVKSMTPRVLVVGGGLTSAVTSALLREELGSRCQLTVWDKARGAGGRMATSRGPESCGGGSTADLGAQYMTVTPAHAQRHARLYAQLEAAGLLAPLTASVRGLRPAPDGSRQLVAPDGTSALVKHFFSRAGVTPHFNRRVTEVSTDGGVCAVTTEAGETETFDAVLLTLPPPQLIELGGSLRRNIESDAALSAGLRAVTYSSRYALALFYVSGGGPDVSWGAQYVTDHPVIRYVAVDNVKRGRDSAPPAVVVHTSVQFGEQHVEQTPDDVQPILMRHVSELFPDWPAPVAVKCQKWRYSQVTEPFPGRPGHAVLSERPLVVAAGDAFTHSNMDGCLQSASGAARLLAARLSAPPPA